MILHQNPRSRRVAFSLMELMVVVAIILVLVGVGGMYFFGQVDKTKESMALTKAKDIGKAL
jgi:prepilin-type N-terminal cleavage/methylation domain-containing protein